ncbi:SAM-dependent methyltransferase [Paenibacillus forsythiae]|uniref:SAM-dependent methyltransferase n=1 Tax=Paenibacillus forsythiae TaxID=365616 RepID=A0ABU3H639_9BACL|nr:class I SAM-dependent methyltransferase [Paenibacillus forsythiae]MDT3425522.1 SAM-dependent methyltransferase [Paenibacillus forsythiae]
MPPKDWKAESMRFDAAADYYDMYRPGYPSDCISQIEKSARLGPQSKILEVGAGSGKASELFLNRGYNLLCIEPGPQLAELGMKKHQSEKVSYAVTRFEHWDGPPGQFDLVFSAQAFHWVPKPAGYEKGAYALKADGRLALFWNMYKGQSNAVHKGYLSVCKENGLVPFQDGIEIEQRIRLESCGIGDSGYFEQPDVYCYPWSKEYDTESFIGFIKTGNGFLGLPESEQIRLIKELTRILDKNGGRITMEYLCVLFLAAKK